ncbi:MAG: hypothetical protein QOD10_6003, partial [Mycobacterium sp.]|nr:hypothetical protein [Mycobacterium sp.]
PEPEPEPESEQSAQVSDEPEDSTEPAPKIPPVTKDFNDEVDLLVNAVESFTGMVEKIVTDERFPRWLKRIADKQVARLELCINLLGEVVDQHLSDTDE